LSEPRPGSGTGSPGGGPSLLDRLRAAPQHVWPGHLLSALVFRLTRSRVGWWKNLLIATVVRLFRVDLSEAATSQRRGYATFNAFFTRSLAPGARPLPDDPRAVACPVDGTVSQLGRIGVDGDGDGGSDDDRIFQAKGKSYSLAALLGGSPRRAEPFRGGSFATLYLSPRDYHRIHMPLAARLTETVYVPGRLFSVDEATTRAVPGLFARNERLACLFETAVGPMAVVMVGAVMVAALETVWAGLVAPPRGRRVRATSHPTTGEGAVELERGAEMGRFNMGSTVIVLFAPGRVRWSRDLAPGTRVLMGEPVGEVLKAALGDVPAETLDGSSELAADGAASG
jgi:phosphatidylserine decarboxylase